MKKILSIALIAALALTSVFAATYNGKAALELGYDLDSSKYGFENSTSRKLKWTITYDTGTAGSEGEGDLRAVIAAEFSASQKVADDSDYVAENTTLPKEDIKFTAEITKADILYKELVRVGILNAGKSADYAKSFYKNYADKISLSDIAEYGNVSISKCSRMFNLYTKHSPIDFLNLYRLEIASNLLRSTDQSISQISSSCGFDQQSYFNRMFKKEYGCTPLAYRKHPCDKFVH